MNLQDKLKALVIANNPQEDSYFIWKDILFQIISKKIATYGNSFVFTLEIPKEEAHGDYTANVALVLAGTLKKSPLEIAQEIAGDLALPDFITSEVVAPGYINFKFDNKYFFKELQRILRQQEKYGSFNVFSDGDGPEKVMVEFGQPNTHKAFTVGHIKGAISGLSVCKLIENLGYKVIKTNYYGDIGMHTAKCTWGIMQRGLPEEFETWDKHKKMDFIAEAYVYATENFDEHEEEIRKINKDIYAEVENKETALYEKIKVWSLEHQKAIFADLGIIYDKQYPESQLFAEAKKIVDENAKNPLAGQDGIFEQSEGAIVYNGENEGLATWVVQTNEGNPTYTAKDIALGFQKFEDYPDLYLNLTLTGVEQKDYFKAVIQILKTLDNKFAERYFHLPFGWLLMDGKKTSSRSGKNIKGTDILEESLRVAKTKIAELKDYDEEKREEIAKVVALAGLKFLILSHEFNKNVNYDPEKFVNFEGYSGPYILYAYVRAKAILKKSEDGKGFDNLNDFTENLTINEFEESLLKWLAKFDQTVYRAGIETAPHLVCVYLFELAQRFNSFYTNCPVLEASSEEEKKFRLALSFGAAQVLKNGLSLLGIETIEEM